MNLGALIALAGFAYLNGIPDWTTQTGAILIGATALSVLNLGCAMIGRSAAAPDPGPSGSYEAALAAIRNARQSALKDSGSPALHELRISSMDALLEITGSMATLTYENLVQAAEALHRRGEFLQVLETLAAMPVAYEVMRLAGEARMTQDEDAQIRVEGLLSFIHAQAPEEGVLELFEADEVRLDAFYPETAFDVANQDFQAAYAPPSGAAAMDIDYEDVVNVALKILPFETISSLSLGQRRALFSRLRKSMEDCGGVPGEAELREIQAWFASYNA